MYFYNESNRIGFYKKKKKETNGLLRTTKKWDKKLKYITSLKAQIDTREMKSSSATRKGTLNKAICIWNLLE